MKCPACEEALAKSEYNTLAVGRCPSCGGSWLTGKGFVSLCQMDGSGFSPRDVAKLKVLLDYKVEKTIKPTEHPCPKCNRHLKARNYANIAGFFIEQCPKGCGVWVREGDLDRIRILRSLGRFEEVKTRAKAGPAKRPPPAATQPTPVSDVSREPAAEKKRAPAKRRAPAKPARKKPAEKAADQVSHTGRELDVKKGFFARLFALLFGKR